MPLSHPGRPPSPRLISGPEGVGPVAVRQGSPPEGIAEPLPLPRPAAPLLSGPGPSMVGLLADGWGSVC